MKVKDILKEKGPEVFTIGEDKPLDEAIKIMVVNKIGSLLALNSDAKIAGIVTERDVLRVTHSHPDNFRTLPVKDIMSKNLIIVEPDDEIEYVEGIMTANRIRHLPVVKEHILIGIISIGDLVKNQLSQIRHENKYLRDYIEGKA